MNERPIKSDNRGKDKREGNRLDNGLCPPGDKQRVKALEISTRELAKRDKRTTDVKKANILSGGSGVDNDTRSSRGASHNTMRSLYYVMMAGMIIAFILLFVGLYQFLVPNDISANGKVTVKPTSIGSDNIVSYHIQGCDYTKNYEGTTSVTLESIDKPSLVSIALSLPITQTIQCNNAVLIPRFIPTGEYRIAVYIQYDVNPVRNLLHPVLHKYESSTIIITNENAQYTLPTINIKGDK